MGSQVGFEHLEAFEIGSTCFIGAGACFQDRFDGRSVIEDNAWIGPQAYFDARELVLGGYVGWGPGEKVLGSAHTPGVPADVPIVKTDLEIRPVRVEAWAGTSAVLLSGVTVGKGAIVGAGAVVTRGALPFAIVARMPAKSLRWREGAAGGVGEAAGKAKRGAAAAGEGAPAAVPASRARRSRTSRRRG